MSASPANPPLAGESPATLHRTSRRAWRLAIALAFLALACGLLLGGLSAWFLGAVAIAGLSATAFTFNFHIPGALVRLFAIGRTAARYGERLAGHRAALSDQVIRRADLFRTMAGAEEVRAAGWQFGDQARLLNYLDDVEDIDFGGLRADLPAATAAFGFLGLLAATLAVTPLAAMPIVVLALACAAAAAAVKRAAGRSLLAVRSAGQEGAGALEAVLASAIPLRAERAWEATLDSALDAFACQERHRLRLRRLQAGFDALLSLVGPAAGASVFCAAWLGGARGDALLLPVFVAFAWLAFSEALQGASRIPVSRLRRDLARARIARWTSSEAASDSNARPDGLRGLHATALQRRAPDGRPLGAPIALDLQAGQPTILVGASGSGKTSLLKQIAGWIGDEAMTTAEGAVLNPTERRAISLYCLHDAAILADTVRANLFAPDATDAALWSALDAVELDDRIRESGGLDAWITQDALSLGEAQRLNLARALLCDRRLILLDEPAEHLDAAQGRRIVDRLLSRLSDRVVVASSHHGLAAKGARTMRL